MYDTTIVYPAVPAVETTVDVSTELAAVSAELGTLAGPSEREFIALGDALARAVTQVQAVEGDFAALTRRLQDDDAAQALSNTLVRIATLSQAGDAVGRLIDLGTATAAAGGRLAALRKTVGEVGVLATNAKIQAVQMGAGAEFAIFTVEIARLGDLAARTLDQAQARLSGLRQSVAGAVRAETAFADTAEAELHQARERIESCLGLMQERRRAAAAAAGDLGECSKRIAVEIGERISELQVNDMTCQRVEHVRGALGMLAGMAELGEPQHRDAVGSACKLQALQLAHAADDFEQTMAGFSRGIAVLASEATAMMTTAEGLLGQQADLHDSSFLHRMETDIGKVSGLLADYSETRAKVDEVIATVAEALAELERDLAAIHSIDSDLRIMALNATLKCGRLGPAGRALAVIAQELRGCSKRTEDGSKAVAAAVDRTMALASVLGGRGEDGTAATRLFGEMERVMARLNAMGEASDSRFGDLRDRCRDVAGLLATTEREVPKWIAERLRSTAGRLQSVAATTSGGADTGEIREDIARLLSRQYTMSSERILHDLFADDGREGDRGQPDTALDDILF